MNRTGKIGLAAVLGIVAMVQAGQVAAVDLLSVYQMAKQRDPQLRAAAANRNAQGEALPIAQAALQPSVSATGQLNGVHQNIFDSPAGSSNDTFLSSAAGVSASYPLYRRDRGIRVEQADNTVLQAQADYETAEQGLMLRVVQAYFNILSAEDNLVFSQAEKKAISRQLDQARQRFDVGLIAITGVHEAQARYDQAHANEISALNDLDNAREALHEIIGEAPQELAGLGKALQLQSPTPGSADAWSELALDNSPGVRSARLASEIARQEMEVQRTGEDFTVDLVGSYNLALTGADTGVDTGTASIGVQLAKPLYTGGGVAAATRQANYRFHAAQENLDRQRRAVSRQARNAYRGVVSSISRVGALDAARISAVSALEATEAGFEVGTRTLVDVLNSQSDLFRARRDHAQARYDYVVNTLTLMQAAGTLSEQELARANAWLQEN